MVTYTRSTKQLKYPEIEHSQLSLMLILMTLSSLLPSSERESDSQREKFDTSKFSLTIWIKMPLNIKYLPSLPAIKLSLTETYKLKYSKNNK